MKIILSAGHGAGKAHNRGALYFNEGDNNFNYSLVLKKALEEYEGVIVDLVRKNINDNPALEQRAAYGKGHDLYIAIHSNAGPATVRGSEVWDSVERKSGVLAKRICDATAALFNHNNRGVKYKEGQKGWNWYGELRGNQATSAMIVEIGFHTNAQDCKFFKDNHEKIAEVQSAAIAEHFKLKKKTPKATQIISKPTATIEQMKTWAISKNANQIFIDLAEIFYKESIEAGVNPIVTYCQSAKETGYMRFGGVLDASFKNPCGLKITAGGGCTEPDAHKKFTTWNEGIKAQVDHLALYAGANGYPKKDSLDPRHFPYLKGTARTVEELGGKWAPNKNYGIEVVKMMKEIESIKIEKVEFKIEKTRIILNGLVREVDAVNKDGNNFVKIRDLEDSKISISYRDKKIIVNGKEFKGEAINIKGNNFIKLRDLPLKVHYDNGIKMPVVSI